MLRKKNSMKKLVIFDLDGTLLNTIEDISDAFNYALINNGLRKASIDEIKYFVGSGVDNLVKRAITKIKSEEEIDKYFDSIKELYLSEYVRVQKNKTRLYEGIMDLVINLKSLNIKVAVLSNKPDSDVKEIIKYYFKDFSFDYVQGQNKEIGIKPSSLGINKILESLNIKKEDALMVGDSDVDVLTGINANVDACAVLWGFRKKEELLKAKYIVSNTLELYEVIVNGI